MKNIKKFIKKNKDYVLAGTITASIILLLTISLGFYGKLGKSFTVCDLYHQYLPFLNYFKNHGYELFSFNKSLGGSMIGTIAYYLVSPINLIVFLFNGSHMYLAIGFIITIKLIISSLTMCFYLKYNNKKIKNLYLFSVCYTFMNFVCVYYFNIIWLDIIYLLPLVMYGIDRLINDKKSIYYIIFLFMTILSNYYMGYIVCIFSVIYFLYKTYLSKKGFSKKLIIKFVISSLFAGLLTAFLTVPTVMEMTNYARVGFDYEPAPVTLTTFLSDIFIGSHNNEFILSASKYNLFCSLICFILTMLYFMNKKINKKERIASATVLIFLVASLYIKPLYTFWHAFTVPSGFNGRFTFLISFFMIILSVKSLSKIKYIEKKHYFMLAPILPIIGVYMMWMNISYLEIYKIYLSIFFYFIYLVFLYYLNNKEYKDKVKLLLIILVCSELFINFYLCVRDFNFIYKQEMIGNYNDETTAIKKVEKDKGFYRIEKSYGDTSNDSFTYDYYSAATFSSTLSSNQIDFLNNMGYIGDYVYIYNAKPMPVTSSILGIKYMFSDSNLEHYDVIDSFDRSAMHGLLYDLSKTTVNVHKNDYSLNLGVAVNSDLSKCEFNFSNDKLDNQNQVVACLYGEDIEVYDTLKIKQKEDIYSINVKNKDLVYFQPKVLDYDTMVVAYLEDVELGMFTLDKLFIQEVKNDKNSVKKLDIKLRSNVDTELYAHSFDEKLYKKVFNKLKKNELILEENNGSYVKANIEVDKENKYIYTTIPYDKGWKVYVDGKETKYDEVLTTFIGFNVDSGKHVIEFKYVPRGLYLGIIITIFSAIGSFIYIKKERK